MNEILYKKNVVNKKNGFTDSYTMSQLDIETYYQKPNNWDMKIIHFANWNGLLTRYCVGYCLQPFDNLYYLKYGLSKNAPWVNREWLPNWGNLTKRKSKLVNSINNYFDYQKKILLYCKLNESNLVNLIFSYLKNN